MFDINFNALLAQFFLGLVNGSIYALLAVGLTVIFGLLRLINFVHGAQYMVAIYEDGTDWSAFPLSLPATYSIYVGRASETIDYGHRIRFSFDHGVDPIETQSAETSVEWVPRGVWIRPPSGHQLFVPVNMFTGGR